MKTQNMTQNNHHKFLVYIFIIFFIVYACIASGCQQQSPQPNQDNNTTNEGSQIDDTNPDIIEDNDDPLISDVGEDLDELEFEDKVTKDIIVAASDGNNDQDSQNLAIGDDVTTAETTKDTDNSATNSENNDDNTEEVVEEVILDTNGDHICDQGLCDVAMVMDINEGVDGSNPDEMTDASGMLYFSATDGQNGRELWRTDGINTELIKDITPSDGSASYPQDLIYHNSRVYFSANDGSHGWELWTSDGTPEETALVEDLTLGSGSTNFNGLFSLGDYLLFNSISYNAETTEYEIILWSLDSQSDTITFLLDTFLVNPYHAEFSNAFYFLGRNAKATEYSVFKTDGTPGGTKKILNHRINNIAALDDALFVTPYTPGILVCELWKTDGIPNSDNTITIEKIALNTDCTINNLTRVGQKLFFTVNKAGSTYPELWQSDGTQDGTFAVYESNGYMNFNFFTDVDGTLFFAGADDPNNFELWKSNGTPEGTKMVKDINSNGSSRPLELTSMDGKLYFTAFDLIHGRELWMSDGTSQGTMIVMDIIPSELDMTELNGTGKRTHLLTNVDGVLYFRSNDGEHGDEVWKYVP